MRRFRRFVHLLWHVPGMFRDDVHRAVTWRKPRGRYFIGCDCGRTW